MSTATDSLMPRRLSAVSPPTTAIAATSLRGWSSAGRNEKIASTPEATEMAIVIYHRRLARFLMRMTSRHDLIEEVINDTLWTVWLKAGDFRGDSLVSTWIVGITYRRALK